MSDEGFGPNEPPLVESCAEPSGRNSARGEMVQLGLLFGAIYFIQGIGEPTEGLIAQPVRSLLKSWGYSAASIGLFVMLLSIPWWVKPLYGLLSDFVPLAGYRRRSYLILTTAVTVLGLGFLYVLPLPPGSYYLLLALLLVPTVGVAFSDVVADALMIEKGQPRGITGQLQSVQWAAMYAATILTGSVGGYLSESGQQNLGFLICAAATVVTLVLAIFMVHEVPHQRPRESFGDALVALGRAGRSPTVLLAGGFLFLWNFNPFSSAVLYMHMTEKMNFSEQFYGHTVSMMSAAMVVASVCYGFYCRRVPFGWLVHASIVMGVLSTIAYWGMSDHLSAGLVSVAVGLTYMTGTLVQLDLAARVCPPKTAGTVFALLMALSNLSVSLATGLGGYLYDIFTGLWGSQGAFNVLVGVGALFTAGCWLLVPFLRRHYGTIADGGITNCELQITKEEGGGMRDEGRRTKDEG
jgi:MFS family permease